MNFLKKFERLNVKKTNYQRVFFLLVGFLGVLCITVGGSYAYLTFEVTGQEINYIQAGTLVVDFANESSGITMVNAVPQRDGEALINNDEYTFTVQNTGSIDASYTVTLKNVCATTSSYPVGEGTVTPDVCIPFDYIRVGVKEGDDVYTVKTPSNGTITLATGELLAGAASPNFSIKIWLSEDTPDDYQGIDSAGNPRDVLFVGKVEINGSQKIS